ncbi:MAG: CHAD domain-containing protein [Myxococcota bacterium]|nr:CHAD domain-containing protein [Myxococcota bacterium]
MKRESLLTRPPEEGARVLALRLLDEAAGALARLEEGDDPEALHDFRVAVRRLRSSLRAYSGALERDVVDTALRRLRALGAKSGSARDLEVQVEWLRDHAAELRPAHQRDLRWLAGRLEARKEGAYQGITDDLAGAFERASADLREMLGAYRALIRLDGETPSHTLSDHTADLLREHAAVLRRRLRAITHPDADGEAHRARIEVKRLRYLLEPVARWLDTGKPLVKRLKALQEVLGELHDLHLLDVTLETTLEEVALGHVHDTLAALRGGREGGTYRRGPRNRTNGLLAICRLARDRREKLFGELEASWLSETSGDFFEKVTACAIELSQPEARHVEIERKYLLNAAPEIVREAPFVEIEQGYLPGQKIRERLRRTRDGKREIHYRTLKMGTGLERAEFEEEIDGEVFRRMWPFTEGCRVHKRRYRVADGNFVWEVDVFHDRDLVLAEVELPTADTEVYIPDWLLPHIVREVTEERDYSNLALAR